MPVTVACLAPVPVSPEGEPGLLANAGRMAAAIRTQKLADPSAGIAVLPHGWLSAGDGVAQASPADALLAPLADVAAAYARQPGLPLDCFLQRPMAVPAEGPVLVQQEIERLRRHDVYAAA